MVTVAAKLRLTCQGTFTAQSSAGPSTRMAVTRTQSSPVTWSATKRCEQVCSLAETKFTLSITYIGITGGQINDPSSEKSTFLFRFSKKFPLLRLGPLKGAVSRVLPVRCGGPRTPSKNTIANLDMIVVCIILLLFF